MQLVGYDRLMLNGIRNFEMKMVSLMQLILGKNGSGKSSLLWEMFPLPGSPEHFQKTGKKVFKVIHHGKHFELINDFGASKVHSFLMDGEDLNPGGTVTVQLSLAKYHFGITPEIRKLLLGKDRFTRMKPLQRKEWFLKLCPSNYDYAIGVFNKLKETLRDISGSIKLDRRNLVAESNKLLGDDEIKKLKDEAEELHALLNHLLEWRKPVETDMDLLDMATQELYQEMAAVAKSLEQSFSKLDDPNMVESTYREKIATLTAEIQQCNAVVNHVGSEIETISKKLDILRKSEEKTIDSLQAAYTQLVSYTCESVEKSMLGKPIESPREAAQQFSAIRTTMSEIAATILTNKDRIYSSQALSEKKNELSALKVTKASMLEHMSSLTANLTHMKKHKDDKDVSCPKCSHSFSLVYDQERVERMESQIDALTLKKTALFENIEQIEKYILDCNEYASMFRRYKQLQSSCTLLGDYWVYLDSLNLIYDNPKELLTYFEKMAQDLELQIRIESSKKEASEINSTLESLKTVGSTSISELSEEYRAKNSLTEEYVSRLSVLNAQRNHFQIQLNNTILKDQLSQKLKDLLKKGKDAAAEKAESIRRQTLINCIRELQSQLATCEHHITESNLQKSLVQNLTDTISKKEKEEAAIKLMIDELSPHGGLIAEGLLGFINNFVEEMNNYIEQVWTYPLTIDSCEIEEGETIDLNYRFPFVMGDHKHPVKDVSEGSTAQMEIFDLAYIATAMRYLGLEDSPLYLDEFSHSFDKEHRTAATMLIKTLVDQQTFPQIFLVSHYLEIYGGVTNVDVVALGTSKIVVPKEHNKYVKIE